MKTGMTAKKQFFTCTPEAIAHLKGSEPALAAHIGRIGPVEREMTPDLFEGLAGSIVGQQISGKAAATVNARIVRLLGGITPAAVSRADAGAIQQCGISMRKVSYLKSAARAFLDGTVPVADIPSMDDGEIIRLLDALPGVGRWTAEMLLIFSLGRQDVFAFDDLGIRKGLARVHGLETVTRPVFEEFRRIYSPYGSTASLYLWHIASE